MEYLYAWLVVDGKLDFDGIPDSLRASVRRILMACGCAHLLPAEG